MSPRVNDLAQRNQSSVLRAMAAVTQKRTAEIAGISETTLSRMKDDELPRLCSLLAALNLNVTPASDRSIDPEKLRALTVLARDSLDAALMAPLDSEPMGL